MRITVLGCGGSLGVPMSGNQWGSCDPTNPRNRRRRPSILVESATTALLVDTGPDLREQSCDPGITRLDAVLFTHSHADHVHGIDDLRPLLWGRGPLAAYVDAETLAVLEARFAYVMASVDMDRGLYRPLLTPRLIEGPFRVGDIEVEPFVQDHGFGASVGFRFGSFAYSTDVANLDDAVLDKLAGLDVWLVDATREEPHPSHSHLGRTLAWIARVRPRRAYLTHMNHTMDYDRLMRILPPGVEPAYDGLRITVE